MANIEMKTLKVGEDVFEIVDEQARENIKELQENGVKTSVESVNGKTGAVTLDASDVGALSVFDIVDNLTTISADKPLAARQGSLLDARMTALKNEFDGLTGDDAIEVDMEEGIISHKESGVTPGSYGAQDGGNLSFGGTFTVPGMVQVDEKGHITNIYNNDYKIPDEEATEEKKGLMNPTDKTKLNKLNPPFNFDMVNNPSSNVDVKVALLDAEDEEVASFSIAGKGKATVSKNSTSGALEINVEQENIDLSGYATTQQLATVEEKIPTVAQDIGYSETAVMSQNAVTNRLQDLRDTNIEQSEVIEKLSEDISVLMSGYSLDGTEKALIVGEDIQVGQTIKVYYLVNNGYKYIKYSADPFAMNTYTKAGVTGTPTYKYGWELVTIEDYDTYTFTGAYSEIPNNLAEPVEQLSEEIVDKEAKGTAASLLNRTTAVNAADTNYFTLMARGSSLNSADTTPAVNGAIAWTYE